MKSSNFKRRVAFTPEEDEIIKKRITDWADKGTGLWVALQDELNRSAATIRYRWTFKLNKHNQTYKTSDWTEEEVGLGSGR